MNKTTKTAQFTPGPWVGYTNTDEGRHIISEAYAQDVIVCEQVHTDADISIIAAAPTMYEALQVAQRYLEQCQGHDEEWQIVTDALAQAEGRQG